ncbi:MAG: hypothetical protein HY854_13155 [Burkholderiales bacterium]|nr:hypothetical protein [Burkholderiales bacterium]
MAAEHSPETPTAEAEAKLRDALAQVKAAEQRHAAVVAALSRMNATPQERRLAQSESKKVEQEMRVAKRLLGEAQALSQATPARKAS